MSASALVTCWGDEFPSNDPIVRLVALAVADGIGDAAYHRRAWIEGLAAKTGLTPTYITAAVENLVWLGVLHQEGRELTWAL